MARRTALRAVAADETPPPPAKPRTPRAARAKKISTAAKESQRELLVAMRDRIARTLDSPNCPPRDLASLSRRLIEIAKEIEAIDARDEEDTDGHDDAGTSGTDGAGDHAAFDPEAL